MERNVFLLVERAACIRRACPSRWWWTTRKGVLLARGCLSYTRICPWNDSTWGCICRTFSSWRHRFHLISCWKFAWICCSPGCWGNHITERDHNRSSCQRWDPALPCCKSNRTLLDFLRWGCLPRTILHAGKTTPFWYFPPNRPEVTYHARDLLVDESRGFFLCWECVLYLFNTNTFFFIIIILLSQRSHSSFLTQLYQITDRLILKTPTCTAHGHKTENPTNQRMRTGSKEEQFGVLV